MEPVTRPTSFPISASTVIRAGAMRFYERALGGKIEIMMSGADSPRAAQIPKEVAHRILHARLVLPDGSTLYAGDAPGNRVLPGDSRRRNHP